MKKYAPVILIIIGCILSTVSGAYWLKDLNQSSAQNTVIAQTASSQYPAAMLQSNGSVPVKVSSTNLSVDITPQFMNGQEWSIAENNASYLATSGRPGFAGNIIVYGHNTHQVFSDLKKVQPGEIISIETASGTTHNYKVSTSIEVNPDEVSYIQPTRDETITLYTCSGFLDSKRWIVQAKPVELYSQFN